MHKEDTSVTGTNWELYIGGLLLCGRCGRHKHYFGSTMVVLNYEIPNQLPNIRDGVLGTIWEKDSPKGNSK